MVEPKVIDLSGNAVIPDLRTEFIPYKRLKDEATTVLYMVLARFKQDHAISYFFVEGGTQHNRLRTMIGVCRDAREHLGDDLIIVETGQTFDNHEKVEEYAKTLKANSQNVNVCLPAIVGE